MSRPVTFPADINDPNLDLFDVEIEVGELLEDVEYRYGPDTATRLADLHGYCAYVIPHTMSPAQILEEARAEADDLRARLETDIREEMEGKRAAWQDHLQEERDAFVATLQRQAGQRVIDITERVLADYADTDMAERVVATFAQRMKALDADAREKMAKAATGQDGPALVQTGTKLGSAARGRITRAIHDTLSSDIVVDYREDPDMVFGLRLSIGDVTVEWSASRYLKRLGTELGEIVDAGTGWATGERAGADSNADAENDEGEGDRPAKDKDQETA